MNKFIEKQLKPLVGGVIVGLCDDGEDEFFGLIIQLPGKKGKPGKKKTIWFLRDDEGNGPGSFVIQEVE